jgi:hypothetical protein
MSAGLLPRNRYRAEGQINGMFGFEARAVVPLLAPIGRC